MIEAFGRTDVGRRRKLNEDSFLVAPELASVRSLRRHGRPQRRRGRVPDGHREPGRLRRAQRSVEKEITWPWGLDANLSFDANRLKTAIRLANSEVFQSAAKREELTGMGTTIVAGLVAGQRPDPLLRRGQPLLPGARRRDAAADEGRLLGLRRLGEGILSSDDVERHPLRNVITKAVGARDSIELDVLEHTLQAGDVLLLCSDGLHGMVSDGDIARLLLSSLESLEEATARLVDAANEAGGRDNVTAVLLRYSEGD